MSRSAIQFQKGHSLPQVQQLYGTVNGFSSKAISDWVKRLLAPGSHALTLLSNLKTSFSGTFHAFNVDKCPRCHLSNDCFRGAL
jgi:hypothetical protein